MKEFECFVCLDVAENAVETSCCHHLLCEVCFKQLRKDSCPHCCRTPLKITVSHFARRLIGNLEVACKYDDCYVELPRSEIKAHEKSCPLRQYLCPSDGCKFAGVKMKFAEHLVSKHENDVIENAKSYFQSHKNGCKPKATLKDSISGQQNAYGRFARLGSTAKYYCGGSLDGRRCRCCDGNCGPDNGCNCSSCMILDVTLRQLPRGWFVNREGAASRPGQTGKFYCGRNVMTHDLNTDGYCGPTNGNNCMACEILGEQVSSRYANVWVR